MYETCYENMRKRVRHKEKQIKLECSVCGHRRFSVLFGRTLCKACWLEERNGRGLCVGCNKLKVIFVRAQRLCKVCDQNRRASKVFRDYTTHFTTPYPYNHTLFDLFVTTIDWDSVAARTNHQLRVFGRFLQTHQLRDPLTWEAIEAVLPALGVTQRTTPQQIRTSLFALGISSSLKGN